jgi:eukaryotic-like serine/threonine-protein kinase
MSGTRPSEDARGDGATPRADDDSFSDIDSLDPAIGDLARMLGNSPATPSMPRASGDEEPSPAKIGRYTVLRRIGSGGMGVVYAAYDDDLDRRVAIKLVHSAAASSPDASLRLRREAQALARLSHPNVIGVHEVGEHGELVFIAMEFVRGKTLREWWSEPERSRQVVLDALVQAGRGLAAVHATGMVHRDVKPENVMIGDDERVRLMDFGLARGDVHEPLPSLDGTQDVGPVASARLTRSGALIGTPAYMAPEQFEGGDVDARTDQFAFCVMAWEALYGERPFAGKTVEQLVATVTAGRRREPPARSGVPQHVRRALVRGLSVDPGARFVDVTTLLDELGRDPRKRRRVIGGTAVVAGLVAFAATRGGAGVDCTDRDARLGVWNEGAREGVRAAFDATGVSYAPATVERVEAGLDAYADAWMTVEVSACEGTDALPTPELRTAQGLCLEHRRRALGALVDVLAAADETIVERAVPAVAALPTVDACTDVEALAARVRPPDDPDTRARVEAVRDELGRARALDDAGAYAGALAIAEPALAQAREIAYGPLVAETLLEVGRLQEATSKYALAEASLREAHTEAVAHGDDETAVDAAIRLVHVVGNQLAHHDAGLEWGWLAAAQLRRIGTPPARDAALTVNVGSVHETRGEYDAALTDYRRALEIREATFGSEHPAVAQSLDSLGGVHRLRGEYDDAIASYRRALEVREAVFGPGHPAIGRTLSGLATVHYDRGEYGDAIATMERSLAILEPALGPDHVRVAATISNLGAFYQRSGDLDRALELQLRALAIDEKTVGSEHPSTAITLENIANIHHARGDFDEALPLYRRSLAIREKVLGPQHPHVGISLSNIGQTHHSLDEFDESLAYFRRSAAISEATVGVEHPDYADALENIGNVLSQREQWAEARDYHERALAIREKALGPDHRNVARSLINLGNVAEGERDGVAALALHERALAISEKSLGPEHLQVALALYNIAQTQLLLGKPALAVVALERVLEIQEHGDGVPTDTADTRYLLAQALVASSGDRSRARALAESARESFRGPKHTQEIFAEVDAWLRAH